MAKKETSSDKIKKLLTQFGGVEEDWKRASKKKNDAGEWVREFENSQTGMKVLVKEKATGEFEVIPQQTSKPDFSKAAAPDEKNEKLYALIPAAMARRFGGRPEEWQQLSRTTDEQGRQVFELGHPRASYRVRVTHLEGEKFEVKTFQPENGFILVSEHRQPQPEPSEEEKKEWREKFEERQRQEALLHTDTQKNILSTPPVDTDAEKNKTADEIIARILECEEVSNEDLRKAGKALANRFAFGIGTNDDGYSDDENAFYLALAPLEDTCYDQHVESYIEHLLPEGMSEECEASFSYSGKMTLMELAEDLMRRGFVLDKGMQQQMDGQQKKPLWPDLKALYDKVRGIASPSKPGNDAPKP